MSEIERELVLQRAREHMLKFPNHDLMGLMIAAVDGLEVELATERRLCSVWASRAKDAEQRAIAAELEVARFKMTAPVVRGELTADDLVRIEREDAERMRDGRFALFYRGKPVAELPAGAVLPVNGLKLGEQSGA